MGATLADAVLQPRVKAILEDYSEARTFTAFHALVQDKGAAQILTWKEGRKPQRLRDLLDVLKDAHVETEAQLLDWLDQEDNAARLQGIKGSKTKTYHYLRMLCGDPEAVAVDVNLREFFNLAGVGVSGDEERADIVKRAARRARPRHLVMVGGRHPALAKS